MDYRIWRWNINTWLMLQNSFVVNHQTPSVTMYGKAVVTLLFFIIWEISAEANRPYQYNELKTELGLYFEEIAEIRFYHEEWKLATYINLTGYQEEYRNLQRMVSSVKKLCSEVKADNRTLYLNDIFNVTEGCGPIVDEMDIIMTEIEEYDSSWFYNGKIIVSRKKRGLLNIIGEVSKSLFGTLSESDSEEYMREFENLEKKGILRDQIIKKQTTIIQSSVNLLQSTTAQLEEKNRQLKFQIDNIRRRVDDLAISTVYIGSIAAKASVQDMISFLTLLIISFQTKQKQFLQAIAIGEKGANNPILIPPQLFMEELDKIRTAIVARDLDLPLEVRRDSITTFYQLASPQVRIVNNQLIISFSIPLVAMTSFNIYKVTSVPNRIQGNYFNFVIPTHEYIAVDKYKNHYVTMSHDEMDNCHHIGGSRLVCKQISPIMTSHNTEFCEVKVLRDEDNLAHCNVRISNLTSEIWIKLRQPNTWIYTLPKLETIHISCGKEVFNQKVVGTGTLSISAGCEIKTNYILIKGFRTSETIVYRNFIPSVKNAFNFNKTVQEFLKMDKFSMKNVVQPNVVNFGQQEKLQAISMSLDEIKTMEDSLMHSYSPKQVRNRMGWLSLIIFFITIMVVLVIGKYTFRKTKKIHHVYRTKRREQQVGLEIRDLEDQINPR